jgi:hypothetical protein
MEERCFRFEAEKGTGTLYAKVGLFMEFFMNRKFLPVHLFLFLWTFESGERSFNRIGGALQRKDPESNSSNRPLDLLDLCQKGYHLYGDLSRHELDEFPRLLHRGALGGGP